MGNGNSSQWLSGDFEFTRARTVLHKTPVCILRSTFLISLKEPAVHFREHLEGLIPPKSREETSGTSESGTLWENCIQLYFFFCNFLLQWCLSSGRGYSEKMRSIQPLRYWKPIWTQSWATCWSRFGQGLDQGISQGAFLPQLIPGSECLWVCLWESNSECKSCSGTCSQCMLLIPRLLFSLLGETQGWLGNENSARALSHKCKQRH